MDIWSGLLNVLILVLAALVLGGVFERLHLSAILGFLLAGTLLGPNAFDLMPDHEVVASIAELGIALLLFTIGLEFSWQRLRRMGSIALGGGSVQVLLTLGLTALVCGWLGFPWPTAVALGAIVAVSSTAAVLRLLVARAEIDSVHGRNALGILLLQDILVVPLAFLVTTLGRGLLLPELGWSGIRDVVVVIVVLGASYLALTRVVPIFLSTREAGRNRDLAILLAIATVAGAAWGSHALGLSPALGAFVAGLLVAESPFATQIRADVASLRTLFVTLFFSSIGTQADPAWALQHWPLVLVVLIAIVIGKSLVTAVATWIFHSSPGHALATGVCLAQTGEFSFVLADVARHDGVIDETMLQLIVTVTIGALFVTPSLVALAPRLALLVGRRGRLTGPTEAPRLTGQSGHVVIIGFGPAGQGVIDALVGGKLPIVVVELHSRTAAVARSYEVETFVGDARSEEVLDALHLEAARAVVVTVPDPVSVRQIIERVRARAPGISIVARARYHVHRWQLLLAGANAVVDEEEEVGRRIASALINALDEDEGEEGSP